MRVCGIYYDSGLVVWLPGVCPDGGGDVLDVDSFGAGCRDSPRREHVEQRSGYCELCREPDGGYGSDEHGVHALRSLPVQLHSAGIWWLSRLHVLSSLMILIYVMAFSGIFLENVSAKEIKSSY